MFTLKGFLNPIDEYPYCVTPIGLRNGNLVGVRFKKRNIVTITLTDQCQWRFSKIRRKDVQRLGAFDITSRGLFAISRHKLISFLWSDYPSLVNALLAYREFSKSNPFIRYSLAVDAFRGHRDNQDQVLAELLHCAFTRFSSDAGRDWYKASLRELFRHDAISTQQISIVNDYDLHSIQVRSWYERQRSYLIMGAFNPMKAEFLASENIRVSWEHPDLVLQGDINRLQLPEKRVATAYATHPSNFIDPLDILQNLFDKYGKRFIDDLTPKQRAALFSLWRMRHNNASGGTYPSTQTEEQWCQLLSIDRSTAVLFFTMHVRRGKSKLIQSMKMSSLISKAKNRMIIWHSNPPG